MRPILFILAICAGLLSCKKDNLDTNSYWHCHTSQNLDSALIAGKLVGSWSWTKQFCFSTGETINANKNVKVNFNSNGTFIVSENSNIATQGNWKLKIVDSNMWGLDLTSPSVYLHGLILICNNEVLFNSSYIDGCDNLFVKAN